MDSRECELGNEGSHGHSSGNCAKTSETLQYRSFHLKLSEEINQTSCHDSCSAIDYQHLNVPKISLSPYHVGSPWCKGYLTNLTDHPKASAVIEWLSAQSNKYGAVIERLFLSEWSTIHRTNADSRLNYIFPAFTRFLLFLWNPWTKWSWNRRVHWHAVGLERVLPTNWINNTNFERMFELSAYASIIMLFVSRATMRFGKKYSSTVLGPEGNTLIHLMRIWNKFGRCCAKV